METSFDHKLRSSPGTVGANFTLLGRPVRDEQGHSKALMRGYSGSTRYDLKKAGISIP